SRPCARVRERADADRERERAAKTATPRLQVRIAQAREPRIGRWQLGGLLQESERDDERRKRVRDRRVAPVDQAQPLAPSVDVVHMQIVVLNRLRYVVRGELGAQLGEARRKPS